MKRIVRLTERDLTRIVKRVIMEEENNNCIHYKDLEPLLNNYESKETLTGREFTKYCGNVESIVMVGHDADGCVHRVENENYISRREQEPHKFGGVIWNDLDKVNFDPNLSKDDLIAMIENHFKEGYDKYEKNIKGGCKSFL